MGSKINKKATLKLACIVPVHNEAMILEEAITTLVAALKKQLSYTNWQVIIASNGSTDRTNTIGRHLERDLAPHIRLIVSRQKGRGQAFRQAFTEVAAMRYLYIDADLPCRLSDLSRLAAPLDEAIDLVTSRRTGQRPPLRRTMTFALRQLNRVIFGITVSDSQCAVKALSPQAATVLVKDCRQNGWYLDTELVVLCEARGLRRSEVPIHWLETRFHGRDSKVRTMHDSLLALRALVQIQRRRRTLMRA